jgi:hypothetical protein
MKTCQKCKTDKAASEFNKCSAASDGLNSWCKQCHREQAKTPKYKAKQSAYYYKRKAEGLVKAQSGTRDTAGYLARHGDKVRARGRVKAAIRRGKMPRASELECSKCGGAADQYHHEDYSKPMGVTPVCSRCHGEIHREQTLLGRTNLDQRSTLPR